MEIDYKALYLKSEEARRQAEEGQQRAEEGQQRAEARERQLEEQQRQTSLVEFLRHCHNVLSRPLRARTPSTSTTGDIPMPTGKHCPTRLEKWVECEAQQQRFYNSVCFYLQPEEDAPHLFPSRIVLDGLSEHFTGSMGAEYDLQTYERLAVEDHTRYIFSELCKIPAARKEFRLGDGVLFDSHTNVFDETQISNTDLKETHPRGKPDQFFIHRVDEESTTLLTTVKYKPPHKLSLDDIHRGLCDMDLWKEMVRSNKVPNNETESLIYNSRRRVCSAITQEYHVMIQEGLEYSYVTTGMALILLWVPYDNPATLHYHLCEPNQEVDNGDGDLPHPNTSIARVLCLCLMSFHSRPRNQEWRNKYCSDLKVWTSQFGNTHEDGRSKHSQTSPSDDTDYESPHTAFTSSEYQPSSSPVESSSAPARRVTTRFQGGCAPSDSRDQEGSPESSGSEPDRTALGLGRKRGFSQVDVSPSQRLSGRNEHDSQNDISHRQNAPFCTQRCLLGLRDGGTLDDSCPNVNLHRESGDGFHHPINSSKFMACLKQQMDENIDRCILLGKCGSYGAPFKLTCSPHGYTVMGKGTTSLLWKDVVSQEAEIYYILRKAQGSSVPVFLGKMDLKKIFFAFGGQIRHMLIMGWAGESTVNFDKTVELDREIERSNKEIRALGVQHLDLRPENVLWNAELGRALIIDFHRSKLIRRPAPGPSKSLKRSRSKTQTSSAKRVRVI